MNLATLLSKELRNADGLPIRYFLRNNERLTVYDELPNSSKIIFMILENDVLISASYIDYYEKYILPLIETITTNHKIEYISTVTHGFSQFYK